MRIILDTNVFVSGVFFSGPAHQILRAWRDGRCQLVLSPEILDEYHRVSEELAAKYPGVEINRFLDLLVCYGETCLAPPLAESVCDDPDDDKFFACAVAANVDCIVSGDKHLLKVSGYRGIEVIRPREFVDRQG